jgi:hypothetical protein
MSGSNVPDICSPNADAGTEMIPTFSDSMTISYPELTVVDVEHTIKRETCFICAQNIMYNEIIRSVLMWQWAVVWKQCALRECSSSTVCLDSPSSHAISHDFLHNSRSISSILSSSLAGVRTVCWRPVFICAVATTPSVSVDALPTVETY